MKDNDEKHDCVVINYDKIILYERFLAGTSHQLKAIRLIKPIPQIKSTQILKDYCFAFRKQNSLPIKTSNL